MEHNQNTTAAINHQRAIRIKFHGHFLLFHQCRNKTSRCREVWQLGTRFSGCCRCGEVAVHVRGSSTVFSKNRQEDDCEYEIFSILSCARVNQRHFGGN